MTDPCLACRSPAVVEFEARPYCRTCFEARFHLVGADGDEVAVVVEAAAGVWRSVRSGREKYGPLRVQDGRDWADEEQQEYRDAAVYAAARRVLMRRSNG